MYGKKISDFINIYRAANAFYFHGNFKVQAFKVSIQVDILIIRKK